MSDLLKEVATTQLSSLSSHDDNASAWQAAKEKDVKWGGRGKGGRALARQTHQPGDINLSSVSLDYDGRQLLDRVELKFISDSRCYGLVGRNGSGKTTLLKAMNAKSIPGFPPNLSCVYLPQEVMPEEGSVLDVMRRFDGRVGELEMALDNEECPNEIERLCEELSNVEEELEGGAGETVSSALSLFGFDNNFPLTTAFSSLSGGERKKVALASVSLQSPSCLMLDEPTNHLDVTGISLLRTFLISIRSKTTVIIVTHDRELIDDIATDIVHVTNKTLAYYKGNYNDFLGTRNQNEKFLSKQASALTRQRTALIESMEKMKVRAKTEVSSSRGKQVESRKKKLERHGVEKDANGHKFVAQTECGMRIGSFNSVDASSRRDTSHRNLLLRSDVSLFPIPDKEVQFNFRHTPVCEFYEPLVKVCDVTCGVEGRSGEDNLFGFLDFTIMQRSTTVIVGVNGAGKSHLLRLLAKEIQPVGGQIFHASNLNVVHFNQLVADELLLHASDTETPLSLMASTFPLNCSDQDLRSALADFGLGGVKANLRLKQMSGGERSRVALAVMMFRKPHLLLLDEPSNHLDLESVQALGFGLRDWDGAVVLTSHDTSLMKMLLDGRGGEKRGGFVKNENVEAEKEEGGSGTQQIFAFSRVKEEMREKFGFKYFVRRVDSFETYLAATTS